MDTTKIIEIIVAILSVITTAGIAIIAFWVKRWINNVDHRLNELTIAMHAMARDNAVSKTQMEQIQGQFKQTQICLDNATSKLGKLSGNIEALWKVLKANKKLLIPTRLSDTDD